MLGGCWEGAERVVNVLGGRWRTLEDAGRMLEVLGGYCQVAEGAGMTLKVQMIPTKI